jgi:hypothetical protein
MASKIRKASIVWILLALVSFTIAFMASLGVILAKDTTGKIIYAVMWCAVGAGWLGRFFIERRKKPSA